MSLIDRLQRLDERLGLDSPKKRQEGEDRRAALKALPDAAQKSLARLRIAALLVLVAVVLAVGLPLILYTSTDDIVVIAFGFLGPFAGLYIGRRLEEHVLEKHRAGNDGPASLSE